MIEDAGSRFVLARRMHRKATRWRVRCRSGLLVFTLKNVHLARFLPTFFQIYFILFCLYVEFVVFDILTSDAILCCALIGQ
jgi:hypothetical protein